MTPPANIYALITERLARVLRATGCITRTDDSRLPLDNLRLAMTTEVELFCQLHNIDLRRLDVTEIQHAMAEARRLAADRAA